MFHHSLVLLCTSFPLILAGELTDKKHKIRGRDYGSSYDPPTNDAPTGYNYPVPIPNPPPQFDEPITPTIPTGLYGPPNQRPNISLPPFQDEIPPSIPTYLPPPVYPPLGPPPQFDPIPTDDTIPIAPSNPPQDQYLPPVPPSTLYGVPSLNSNPVQFRVFNMSCLDSTSRRFFRSTIRTSQLVDLPPVVDNSRSDCVFGSGDTFRIDLNSNQMTQCGVRYCSGSDQLNLCVPLRLPTVRGLRLPEDSLITLQCRPQDRVVSHTKHLRVNPQIIQGRSAATVASGGVQKNFETQVGLFRRAPGNNDFTQIVTPGSAVQLGEDLQLRAAVRDGDGWKYSRMGTVTMQRIASRTAPSISRTTQDSVTLVDSLGCRVPAMRSVCPENPRQVNPLVTTFPFRAFMFQGANSGDEMVLSVRMLGCLQYEDCFQNLEAEVKTNWQLLTASRTTTSELNEIAGRSCEEKVQTRARSKRESTRNESTTDWQSYLEFKVVLPEYTKPGEIQPRIPDNNATNPVLLFGGLTTLMLLTLCLVVTILRRK